MMIKTAKEVPKACYGLEFDLATTVCRSCEFQRGCFDALGVRRNKVTLDKITFSLVPPAYGIDARVPADPEIPVLERTYLTCYQAVFGKRPRDRVGHHSAAILSAAKAANCSLRMFMLANMVGFQQQHISIAQTAEHHGVGAYRAAMLTHANAVSRVEMYREMCHKAFGTFDLTSLDVLTDGSCATNDIENKMLDSEVTAARFLVGFKLKHGGPAWTHLYAAQELALDPCWLATEKTYRCTVLEPYLAGSRGTKMEAEHRYSVTQVVAQMKKRKDWSIALFQARERIMPHALREVVHAFGFDPKDFEIENSPVTDPAGFWVFLARAMQHVHCLRYVDGEQSMFRR